MTESFFDRINKNKTLHTPDVLSCLANLSNDEVFTPPEVVNKIAHLGYCIRCWTQRRRALSMTCAASGLFPSKLSTPS